MNHNLDQLHHWDSYLLRISAKCQTDLSYVNDQPCVTRMVSLSKRFLLRFCATVPADFLSATHETQTKWITICRRVCLIKVSLVSSHLFVAHHCKINRPQSDIQRQFVKKNKCFRPRNTVEYTVCSVAAERWMSKPRLASGTAFTNMGQLNGSKDK